MKVAIITIGNELISGDVVNTYAAEMAQALTEKGFEVTMLVSIPEDEREIAGALLRTPENIDVIMVTGGSSEIAVHSVAKALGQGIPLDKEVRQTFQRNFFQDREEMSAEKEKLVNVPQNKEIPPALPNASRGFFLRQSGKIYICLPGFSQERQILLKENVIPLLEKERNEKFVLKTRTFKIFNLTRKAILDRLEGLNPKNFSASLNLFPSFPEQHIRVTTSGRYLEEVQENIQGLENALREKFLENIFGVDQETIEEIVGHLLRSSRSTLATAESCTGGLVAHRLTNIAGSSEYFDRGIVAYSNRAKVKNLKIPKELLDNAGAVSAPVAEKMAEGIRQISHATFGLGITGIAGPGGGSPEKPVGTVYIALASPQSTVTQKYQFAGDRQEIKTLTAHTAFDMIRRYFLKAN